MVKLFFKPLQGLRGRGVEPHIRKGLLQESLRKQGLKLTLESLYRNIRTFIVAKGSKKTMIETSTLWDDCISLVMLQRGLRKQGLKQSETPFGVSDTFPAYKKYWHSLWSKNNPISLIKLSF